jgi:hypothetical protein
VLSALWLAFAGDIVDSDPLVEFEADPDPGYADADLETDVPPPE